MDRHEPGIKLDEQERPRKGIMGMASVTDWFIRQMHRELLQEDAKLTRLLGRGPVLENDRSSDVLDNAQWATRVQTEAGINTILTQRLGQIRKALNRIDTGEYAVCETCGRQIGVQRQRVSPEVTMCMRCQQTLESTGKRAGSDVYVKRLAPCSTVGVRNETP
jgi:DnaK suppressor protein